MFDTFIRFGKKYGKRVFALAIALIGILFLSWTIKTKVPEIEEEIGKKQSSIGPMQEQQKNLADLEAHREEYLAETEKFKNDAVELLNKFPADMLLEDNILYIDHMVNDELSEFALQNTSYGQTSFVMDVSYSTEEGVLPLELGAVSISSSFEDFSYEQFRKLLDYGLTSPQRFVINNIATAYNEETGYLSGSFSFQTYCIKNQIDKEYQFDQKVLDDLGDERRTNNLFDTRETIVRDEDGNIIDPETGLPVESVEDLIHPEEVEENNNNNNENNDQVD